MVQFAVITEVPNDLCGNYACNEILINPDADNHIAGSNIIVDPPEKEEKLFVDALTRKPEATIDLTKRQIVLCNTPVFRWGEIMIIGDCDRTIPDGRKPSKWDVGCEYFNDIEDAIKRAKEVVE